MTDRRLFASITIPLPGTFADDARITLAVGGEIEKLKAALTKHGIAAEIEEKTVTVRPKKAAAEPVGSLNPPPGLPALPPTVSLFGDAAGMNAGLETAAANETVREAVSLSSGAQPIVTEREAPDTPPAASTIPTWAR